MDLNLIEKKIRAQVIKDHMAAMGIERAVCFTCGNASAALRRAGVEVLGIGETQELAPQQWFTQGQIARAFPQHFNATSGDLPVHLMQRIAERMREHLGPELPKTRLKIGSGETAVVMAMAYPHQTDRIRLYRTGGPETEYSSQATLNALVEAIYGTLATRPTTDRHVG